MLPVLPPRNAVLEIIVLLVPVILLEWLVPNFPDLTLWQPHPYWFPVLLLSLQYGTVSGLLAAAVATIGVVLVGLPETEIEENHFTYLFRVWIQPGLWILAALLLGQFRMRQIERKAELVREVNELQTQNKDLAGFLLKLRAQYGTLERTFAAQSVAPADRLLDALAVFANVKPAGLGAAFSDCIGAALPDAQASLYAVENRALRCVATAGWATDAQRRAEFPPDDPLYRGVITDARRVCVLTATDEPVLAGEGLAAVPIIASASGLVIGMLKVEALAPSALDTQLVRRLNVLADHLSGPLQKFVQAAADGERLDMSKAADEVTPLRFWHRRQWKSSSPAETSGSRPGTRR